MTNGVIAHIISKTFVLILFLSLIKKNKNQETDKSSKDANKQVKSTRSLQFSLEI